MFSVGQPGPPTLADDVCKVLNYYETDGCKDDKNSNAGS